MVESKLASMEFSLTWQGPHAEHTDRVFFPRINFWRDILPGRFEAVLPGMAEGEKKAEQFGAGALFPPYSEENVHRIKESQIDFRYGGSPVNLQRGRFYPRGMITAAGIYKEDKRPVRYLGKDEKHFLMDFNHPLASYPVSFQAEIVEHLGMAEEYGGRCSDVVESLAEHGSGLQASHPGSDTEFLEPAAFSRMDETEDRDFYRKTRFVNHLDAKGLTQISSMYERFLAPGMRVLDLMSSWDSHLSQEDQEIRVTGLGLNAEEMKENPRLEKQVIHDINQAPEMPFGDSEFDAALCTVSVEYLTDPIRVFEEVGRVLVPGAPFLVTFSDRWFPPKVISLWRDLHSFERMGLVVEYFRKTGRFENLKTESVQGYPRPTDDKYFPEHKLADPIFAVWGRSK